MKARIVILLMVLGACDAFGPTEFDTYEGIVESDRHLVTEGFRKGAEVRCRIDGENRPVRAIPSISEPSYCLVFLNVTTDQDNIERALQAVGIRNAPIGVPYRVQIARP